ncbi:Asp-tRNA(Asn)/Glu-tRNA(Gln) amidotransferase subunit GatA [Pseudenhygromyxa sp. WMMC2535]|uniref:Asp-tRNA(Asn)/Glu-tRNA(Gln) amidotransferase subunit GatA n=1 Tax=Pseudenhygromyxa sp. WMMC2535 TaxID=2712867 RepID=UPI001554AD6D|nr:Asp-tRNA(Asn)/Glu-tRNA(Gln) amidotransferase subunit GatA [Pseudenhygromyxa sp. WMMC2535]NVB39140.1 Asp-tRNA(Asn)/Glu-tRNA(Gln) amidotransferase subunit GatA [Pseudenhygromyxa sp. WMMC2535]
MADQAILAESARALAASVRSGERSAREITEAFLARADASEAAVHAFCLRTPERALADADAVDAARAKGEALGPLAGVPVGLKDIFVTEGIETRCGSAILSGWIPPYEGSHARRLREAGAVLVGKLAMDEFAMGSSSENTPFEPVRNPWALDYVPGGSSGGSAAAVAARSCALSLGSDTGGSIRQPASFCGVVGLKPTYGRVSRHGMIAFASSLDQAGPLAREVEDVGLALQVIAGHDPLDATSSREPVPDYLTAVDEGARGELSGLRVGVPRSLLASELGLGLHPAVEESFGGALERLRGLGATLVDVELPHFEHAVATYYVLCTAEASSNLARYDGLRYGLSRDPEGEGSDGGLLGRYAATRHAGFGAEVKRRILLGTFVLRAESYADYYGRAMKVRTLIARGYASAFAGCDLIASPVSPVPGWRRGEKLDDPLSMYLSDVFTIGANLAGLPAISIPAGICEPYQGCPSLPMGLQLLAPRFGEASLLRTAAAHEAALGWRPRTPAALAAHLDPSQEPR